jgi:hypothetical protein
MPSSTSSSERRDETLMRLGMPGDDPAAAQGPVLRPLPGRALGGAAALALLLFALGFAAWEGYWRAYGAVPGYRNSDGLWAMQRRRIDQGEGDALVVIGSSRIFFDLRLDVWERLSGERPIQLALEGTSPLTFLEDLAADEDFTGRLLVGVTPAPFVRPGGIRAGALDYYRKETPAQRAGQWLSMHLLEPWLAFYDPDFALFTVFERQHWPPRAGARDYMEVRKLAVTGRDRDTRLWDKLVDDPEYADLAKRIWRQFWQTPPPPGMDPAKATEAAVARAAAAIGRLRARGVEVILVAPPSDGEFRAFEQKVFPRARLWDPLVARAGAPGIHFEDHPDMQGLELPEWSHLSPADSVRYTRALHRAVRALEPPSPTPSPSR